MPDIFLPDTRPTKIKLRAARIEIENCKQGEKSVTYHEETTPVYADDGTYATPERTEFVSALSVPFRELATTVYQISDPVTGETHAISGAAVALWLEDDYVARALARMSANQEGA